MSSTAPVNGAAQVESKSAKKRKAKTAAAPAPSTTDGSSTPGIDAHGDNSEHATNSADSDSPYLKELQKQLRNANKKLSASAKTESVVSENPSMSLDELVAAKKINNDQRAQLLKKPAIQEQIKAFEEQIKQYRQFGKDYEDRFAREKSGLQESHEAEINKIKLEAAEQALAKWSEQQETDLLVLTQFLNAASSKRNDDSIDDVEKAAFEGVLVKIYQGSTEAIVHMKNLVSGSDAKVTSIEGDELEFTYQQVKELSISANSTAEEPEQALGAKAPGSTLADDVPAVALETSTAPATDPTVAHAGMTELADTVNIPTQTNGVTEAGEDTPSAIPEQASIDAGSGNAIAESSWDPTASAHDSWVEVPRDPTETETGFTATPAATNGNTNSWAEEMTEGAAVDAKVAAENDGFEQVVHHHPRGRGRGGDHRGRGRGGGYRGGRGRGGADRGERGERGERGDRGERGERTEGGERRGGGRGRGRGEGGQYRGGRGGGRGRDGQGSTPRPAENTGNGGGW